MTAAVTAPPSLQTRLCADALAMTLVGAWLLAAYGVHRWHEQSQRQVGEQQVATLSMAATPAGLRPP